MPRYTNSFNPKKGAYLEILLSKPRSMYNENEAISSQRKLSMLIDTGASTTAISPAIAQEIGLVPIGKKPLKSATSEVKANLYNADFTCDLLVPELYIPDLEIIEFQFGIGWRDGFLGRNFLSKIMLELNGLERTYTITV